MIISTLGVGKETTPFETNTSFLIRSNINKNSYIMFDCGHNVFSKLLNKIPSIIDKIKFIYLSHIHDDHFGSMFSLAKYINTVYEYKPSILCEKSFYKFVDYYNKLLYNNIANIVYIDGYMIDRFYQKACADRKHKFYDRLKTVYDNFNKYMSSNNTNMLQILMAALVIDEILLHMNTSLKQYVKNNHSTLVSLYNEYGLFLIPVKSYHTTCEHTYGLILIEDAPIADEESNDDVYNSLVSELYKKYINYINTNQTFVFNRLFNIFVDKMIDIVDTTISRHLIINNKKLAMNVYNTLLSLINKCCGDIHISETTLNIMKYSLLKTAANNELNDLIVNEDNKLSIFDIYNMNGYSEINVIRRSIFNVNDSVLNTINNESVIAYITSDTVADYNLIPFIKISDIVYHDLDLSSNSNENNGVIEHANIQNIFDTYYNEITSLLLDIDIYKIRYVHHGITSPIQLDTLILDANPTMHNILSSEYLQLVFEDDSSIFDIDF